MFAKTNCVVRACGMTGDRGGGSVRGEICQFGFNLRSLYRAAPNSYARYSRHFLSTGPPPIPYILVCLSLFLSTTSLFRIFFEAARGPPGYHFVHTPKLFPYPPCFPNSYRPHLRHCIFHSHLPPGQGQWKSTPHLLLIRVAHDSLIRLLHLSTFLPPPNSGAQSRFRIFNNTPTTIIFLNPKGLRPLQTMMPSRSWP